MGCIYTHINHSKFDCDLMNISVEPRKRDTWRYTIGIQPLGYNEVYPAANGVNKFGVSEKMGIDPHFMVFFLGLMIIMMNQVILGLSNSFKQSQIKEVCCVLLGPRALWKHVMGFCRPEVRFKTQCSKHVKTPVG